MVGRLKLQYVTCSDLNPKQLVQELNKAGTGNDAPGFMFQWLFVVFPQGFC
jgi:hypothetical protein